MEHAVLLQVVIARECRTARVTTKGLVTSVGAAVLDQVVALEEALVTIRAGKLLYS